MKSSIFGSIIETFFLRLDHVSGSGIMYPDQYHAYGSGIMYPDHGSGISTKWAESTTLKAQKVFFLLKPLYHFPVVLFADKAPPSLAFYSHRSSFQNDYQLKKIKLDLFCIIFNRPFPSIYGEFTGLDARGKYDVDDEWFYPQFLNRSPGVFLILCKGKKVKSRKKSKKSLRVV